MVNSTPFGPITWQVVLVVAGYLVMLGVQFANLLWLQRVVDELKKKVDAHIDDDQKRLRALERVQDRITPGIRMRLAGEAGDDLRSEE